MDNATRATGVSAIVEFDYAAKEPDELDLTKGAIIHNIKQQPGGWWEGTLLSNGITGMFPDNFVRLLDVYDDKTVTLRDKSATSNRRCKVIYSYSQLNDDELSLAVGDVIDFLGEVEEGWWRGKLKGKVGVFPSNFVVNIEPSPIFATKRPIPNLVGKSSTAATIAATEATSAVSNNSGKLNRVKAHGSKDDLLNHHLTSHSNSVVSLELNDAAAPTLPPKPIREYCRVVFPYSPQNEDELELVVGDIITIISTDLLDKGWWKGELKGAVGVFPDNFVKLLPPTDDNGIIFERKDDLIDDDDEECFLEKASVEIFGERMANFINTILSPINDSHQQQNQQSQQTASSEAGQSATLHASITTVTASSPSSSSNTIAASKVFVKKSGSTSSTQSSNRKDSFGSRDSLNDILTETGIQSGNVAAQRKSLENKNLELTNSQLVGGGDASSRAVARKSSTDVKTTNEMRKSVESMDEKKTPPPVLTKKPTVPTKKSGSVTSVAGNILSGLKQKVKNVEHKLHSSTSHDSADGICGSKLSTQMIADNNEKNVVAERLRRDDSEFDNVERASMLPDMRAGRVKAPKRRPPSSAINAMGESNNNNCVYLNGSASAYLSVDGEERTISTAAATTGSSDDNSEELLAKPKPREWEKKKAPWMEELKASQVKKKTSPSVEPRTIMTDRSSKIVETADTKTQINTATKMQHSSTVSTMQHSMSLDKKDNLFINDTSKHMSMSTSVTQMLHTEAAPPADDVRLRPSSLSIRNRSISPIGRVSGMATSKSASLDQKNAMPAASSNVVTTSYSTASISTTANHTTQNHSVLENNVAANLGAKVNAVAPANAAENNRVHELERRVEKLESQVQLQQKIIDDLVRTLREEAERVKGLKTELDKYAQCVTQV